MDCPAKSRLRAARNVPEAASAPERVLTRICPARLARGDALAAARMRVPGPGHCHRPGPGACARAAAPRGPVAAAAASSPPVSRCVITSAFFLRSGRAPLHIP